MRYRPLISLSVILFVTSMPTHADLPTGTGWHAIPNTRLRSVCAGENGFSTILGGTGCPAITAAWNSAVFDSSRNRLIIWGGGHNDYYGNEIYAVELDTASVHRLTDPGLPRSPSGTCQEAIADGTQPNSRHTYDGIEYIARTDQMFVFGGSLACARGTFGSDTWTFDFKTDSWRRMTPTGPIPWGDAGVMTAYDQSTGLVYLHDRKHLYSYDAAVDRYTQVSTSATTLGYHMAATIDQKRRRFVIVGHDGVQGEGRMYAYDLTPASTVRIQQIGSSGASILSERYPGLEYDPTQDKIVAWGQSNPNSVFIFDPDANQWTTRTISGGPTPAGNGTHGRLRYSTASGVFVLANSVDENVMILRLDNAPARPNPPNNVTAQ